MLSGGMYHRHDSVAGFVLAGGASRRMGFPKASLMLGDETMIQRQVRLLRSVCGRVAVLGPSQSFSGLDVPAYPDEIPGCGPLGGIHTGLLRTRKEFNVVLGCDLPFMEKRFLGFLCRCALERRADVIVPESSCGKIEPLCGVYRRRALWAVRASLLAGENKLTRFFTRVRVRVIPWKEIYGAAFGPRIFANMNTPEDYESAKKWFLVPRP